MLVVEKYGRGQGKIKIEVAPIVRPEWTNFNILLLSNHSRFLNHTSQWRMTRTNLERNECVDGGGRAWQNRGLSSKLARRSVQEEETCFSRGSEANRFMDRCGSHACQGRGYNIAIFTQRRQNPPKTRKGGVVRFEKMRRGPSCRHLVALVYRKRTISGKGRVPKYQRSLFAQSWLMFNYTRDRVVVLCLTTDLVPSMISCHCSFRRRE